MNAWELIFIQSPVNDGYYHEMLLPELRWEWPQGTWFQARLDYIRERQTTLDLKSKIKTRDSRELRTM